MFLVALFALVGGGRRASADSVDDLIGAAKKEGRVEYYALGTLTPKAAKAIAKAFNKKYGLNIKVALLQSEWVIFRCFRSLHAPW